MKSLNQSGQSLLEIVVTMGLGLIVITGIAVVTVNGLKNSQLAKNQVVATQLAQQGLEEVRSMKSQNCPAQDSAGAFYWKDNSALVYNNFPAIPGPIDFVISTIAPATTTTPCLLQTPPAAPADPTMTAFPNFNRKIEISCLPTDAACTLSVVRVTAIVTWSDYSGDHESRIATTFGQD